MYLMYLCIDDDGCLVIQRYQTTRGKTHANDAMVHHDWTGNFDGKNEMDPDSDNSTQWQPGRF